MKKLTLIFALLMSTSAFVMAQSQLTWRFDNYQVINAGAQLQFDVEVKANTATTDHRDLQVYFDYNSAGFGSDIVANGKVTVTPLTLMNDYYSIVNDADNTSSKFAVITEATHEMTENGGSGFFNVMPTTFTGLLQITIDIADNAETAGIAFDENLMDGGQYYQESGTTSPIKYDDPCIYDNDLSGNMLSTVFGNVTYANAGSSVLSDITVTLMDGAVPVTSDVSDSNGDYNLSDMAIGSYTLENSTTKAWGGLTMNDVNLTRQSVSGGTALTGLYWLAAEVTWNGSLDMADVLLLRQRVANNPAGTVFNSPDWIFDDPQSVTVGPNGIGTKTYQGICSGDADGSFTPPVK